MKKLFLVLAICLATTMFAQQKDLRGNVTLNKVKVENFEIAVEVDSVEEIESTFTVNDFKKILNDAGNNEDITFKMKCNDRIVGGEVRSHIEYKIKGNTNDKKSFLKRVRKLRKAAIEYYNSRK